MDRGTPDRFSAEGTTDGTVGFLSQEELDVETHRIVEPDGSYDPGDVPDLSEDEFVDLYRWMRVEQRYAERMVKLQRRGEMGTVSTGRGQEASIVGSGYALGEDDWLLGMGREITAMFIQGVSMRDMILFWRGVEDAAEYIAEENCMIGISIGGHLPMVTGIAWGMDLTDADSIVAAYLGDGATSTGASHEAINFAGVLDVPAVFFCQNNQWAISTPFEKQTNANTLAQRALGYGMDGIRVDGMDVLAVYDAMTAARERARDGRPMFVESLCYRLDAHTTSDDPSRYRDEVDTEPWEEQEPIERYRRFLESEGLWEEIDDDAIVEGIDEEFDAALEAANAFEERDVGEVFEHVYDELPPVLARQLEDVRQFFEEHPEAYDHVDQRPKG